MPKIIVLCIGSYLFSIVLKFTTTIYHELTIDVNYICLLSMYVPKIKAQQDYI